MFRKNKHKLKCIEIKSDQNLLKFNVTIVLQSINRKIKMIHEIIFIDIYFIASINQQNI